MVLVAYVLQCNIVVKIRGHHGIVAKVLDL